MWGYVLALRPVQTAVWTHRLYYLGSRLVLVDQPQGHVLKRPALSKLMQWMAKGDRLICSNAGCFGSKPDRQDINISTIEEAGIEVRFARADYFTNDTDELPLI